MALSKQQMVIVTLPMAPCGSKANEKEGATERPFAAAQVILLAGIMLKFHIHKIQELHKVRKWVLFSVFD